MATDMAGQIQNSRSNPFGAPGVGQGGEQDDGATGYGPGAGALSLDQPDPDGIEGGFEQQQGVGFEGRDVAAASAVEMDLKGSASGRAASEARILPSATAAIPEWRSRRPSQRRPASAKA
jgi:hypothetical protein